jgi:hypothetical protein
MEEDRGEEVLNNTIRWHTLYAKNYKKKARYWYV